MDDRRPNRVASVFDESDTRAAARGSDKGNTADGLVSYAAVLSFGRLRTKTERMVTTLCRRVVTFFHRHAFRPQSFGEGGSKKCTARTIKTRNDRATKIMHGRREYKTRGFLARRRNNFELPARPKIVDFPEEHVRGVDRFELHRVYDAVAR